MEGIRERLARLSAGLIHCAGVKCSKLPAPSHKSNSLATRSLRVASSNLVVLPHSLACGEPNGNRRCKFVCVDQAFPSHPHCRPPGRGRMATKFRANAGLWLRSHGFHWGALGQAAPLRHPWSNEGIF